MRHYHCDGCGVEIPDTKKGRFTWTLWDGNGVTIEKLDVCKKCNQIITEATEKVRKRTTR